MDKREMYDRPLALLEPLIVGHKRMMGAGPSNVSPRVLHAMSQPLMGLYYPAMFKLLDEIKKGLQYVFQTKNELTLAITAAGNAGMEAAMANLIEPGEVVLIAKNGFWGDRAVMMASRRGAVVKTVETTPGTYFKLSDIEDAIMSYKPTLFFITQGESSTGVCQPLVGLGKICRKYDCLLVVDSVASTGAVELFTDRWGIDCIYAGAQKALGGPPGITAMSFSPRAVKKIRSRKTPVDIYYLDMTVLGRYWGCFPNETRIYHHTLSPTLLYGLREGLAQIVEEGLENSIKRHENAAKCLYEGLAKLGFEIYVADVNARLVTVTPVKIPAGLDWQELVKCCLSEYDLELSVGLGPTAGIALRIGAMGYNANTKTVQSVLNALEKALERVKQSKL